VTRWVALRIGVLCWLTMVWVMLWGNLSAANVLSGLAVAVLITVLLPLPVVAVQGRLHPLSLLRLVVMVCCYLARSSAHVAWLAVRFGPPPRSAVLRAQLTVKSDLVLALLVHTLNLIPGTVVVEIDGDNRLIYVHVFDVGSTESVARFHREVAEMERLLVAAFERDSDWRPVSVESDRP
jgi:multicomponent Na+:H+ antiporter subunit E